METVLDIGYSDIRYWSPPQPQETRLNPGGSDTLWRVARCTQDHEDEVHGAEPAPKSAFRKGFAVIPGFSSSWTGRNSYSCRFPPLGVSPPKGAGATCLFVNVGERASTQHRGLSPPTSQNTPTSGLPGSQSDPKQRSFHPHHCPTSGRGPSPRDLSVKVKAVFHSVNVALNVGTQTSRLLKYATIPALAIHRFVATLGSAKKCPL